MMTLVAAGSMILYQMTAMSQAHEQLDIQSEI
jgi:hypothetical protein